VRRSLSNANRLAPGNPLKGLLKGMSDALQPDSQHTALGCDGSDRRAIPARMAVQLDAAATA
jgi:hypothetical protein